MSTKNRRAFLKMLVVAPVAVSGLLGCNAIPTSSMRQSDMGLAAAAPASSATSMPAASPANGPVHSPVGTPTGAPNMPQMAQASSLPGQGQGGAAHVHGPGCGPNCTHETTPINPNIPNQAVVVIRKGEEKSERIMVNLDQETHVNDLLAKTRASDRFRRIDLQLIRTSPNGQKHRMGVAFDGGKRKVKPEADYFVRPGDVLVVTEDPTTIIDDLLGRKAKPSAPGSPGRSSGIRGMLGG